MKRKLTDAEAAAECQTIVAEFERTRGPYDVALFWQKVDRELAKLPRCSTEQLGGCQLIRPDKFKGKS
jgi:hypothetical protein